MMAITAENTITCGLVKGRHEMPVENYIFDSIEDMFDYESINEKIIEFLINNVGICRTYGAGINQNDYTDVEIFCGNKNLVVYVTGLTSITAALIRACAMNGVSLTLMHFNMVIGEYVPQVIF